MERVKIFAYRSDLAPNLEKAINDWLDKNEDKIEITRIFQSCGQYEITISIFYKIKQAK